MKTTFRLFAVLFISTTLFSCSKSANQLPVPDGTSHRMNRSRDAANPWELWTKVYPMITQPRVTVLGNPDSYLYDGDQAVFFFIISNETSSDSYSGTLNLVDDATGNVIQTVNLLPYYDPAGGSNIQVPDEVAAFPYMFAFVNIDPQYTGKTVSLQTSIQLPTGETSTAALPAAFIGQ